MPLYVEKWISGTHEAVRKSKLILTKLRAIIRRDRKTDSQAFERLAAAKAHLLKVKENWLKGKLR